jgi:hypothetical protein
MPTPFDEGPCHKLPQPHHTATHTQAYTQTDRKTDRHTRQTHAHTHTAAARTRTHTHTNKQTGLARLMSVLYSDDIVPAAAMAANILRPGCSFTSLLQTVHHTVTVARLLLFLLLQYLLQSCSREGGGGGDNGGHVLRETTSRGLCGLVCPSRTGTRDEPGTLTQGGALFPWFLSFGNRTQNSRVAGASPTTSPSGDLIPTIRGSGAHPGRGKVHVSTTELPCSCVNHRVTMS